MHMINRNLARHLVVIPISQIPLFYVFGGKLVSSGYRAIISGTEYLYQVTYCYMSHGVLTIIIPNRGRNSLPSKNRYTLFSLLHHLGVDNFINSCIFPAFPLYFSFWPPSIQVSLPIQIANMTRQRYSFISCLECVSEFFTICNYFRNNPKLSHEHVVLNNRLLTARGIRQDFYHRFLKICFVDLNLVSLVQKMGDLYRIDAVQDWFNDGGGNRHYGGIC